jgi:hypothetical protein
VLRAIQGHAGHAGSEAKLDILKFLGSAALGFCTNFNGRAAFHDEYLLTGGLGSGAEFDASTQCRAGQAVFERECAMSLLAVRPVGTTVILSAFVCG